MMRALAHTTPRQRDRLIALAAIVGAFVELAVVRDTQPRVGATAAALLVGCGALAWRRSRPLIAGAVMFAAWFLLSARIGTVDDLQTPLVTALVMSFSMGAYTRGRAVPASLLVVFAGMAAVVTSFPDKAFTDYVFPIAFALVAWLAGRAVTTRTRLTEELHETAVRAQEAQETELARATADERRRIAREMHDVVAHSVSVMVVQAGGARRILEQDPARAVEAAGRIEDVGRAALAEMRRLLGVLGHEDDGRAPQPTLRELDALVERSRAAGLPVDLTVTGDPRPLPAGMDLAAYRVVQEALTNAIKYSGAAPTEVAVRWEPETLELAIADRGAVFRGPAGEGGHGLVGMEERVRLYDGELRAGPRRGGGFEVVARLPLPDGRPMAAVRP
jgi:signal transduction histidine kinase